MGHQGEQLRLRARSSCLAVLAVSAAAACPSTALGDCPNANTRQGPSASLPDCRSFELVTPRDTNGALPRAAPWDFADLEPAPRSISTSPAAGDGIHFLYLIAGTDLPGGSGGGVSNVYEATRGPAGWSSTLTGPTGSQATIPVLAGASADLSAAIFSVLHQGARYGGLLDLGTDTSYYRAGAGAFQLLGEGTLPALPDDDGYLNGFADEPAAVPDWISSDGERVVFQTRASGEPEKPARLLASAPSNGVPAIYERGPGILRLVSILPGNVTPATASDFAGASADGSVVVFTNGGETYARLDNERTAPITGEDNAFAGISASGNRIFFVEGGGAPVGNLMAWEAGTEEATPIATTGDARFVNVSADGSHAYFISPSQLDGGKGVSGKPNLYVWTGKATRFVATLDTSDLARSAEGGYGIEVGLNLWMQAVRGEPLMDTSRTNRTGTVLVFESAAGLTPDAPSGVREVYRYEAEAGTLTCVSCPPEGVEAAAASLASYKLSPLGSGALLFNLSDDGSTVIFQTATRLTSDDADSELDVYRWHSGELALISLGNGAHPSLFLGATPDAGDIFFRSAEALVGDAQEPGIAAIYDARVSGGFPPASPPPPECGGESCRPEPAAVPTPPALATTQVRNLRHEKKRHRGRRRCAHHRHRKHGCRAHLRRGRGRR